MLLLSLATDASMVAKSSSKQRTGLIIAFLALIIRSTDTPLWQEIQIKLPDVLCRRAWNYQTFSAGGRGQLGTRLVVCSKAVESVLVMSRPTVLHMYIVM